MGIRAFFRRSRPNYEADLCARGLPAEGTVLEYSRRRWSAGPTTDAPAYGFSLSVRCDSLPDKVVKHTETVPQDVVHHLGKGAILPLKLDPNDPDEMIIDWYSGRAVVPPETTIETATTESGAGTVEDRLLQLAGLRDAGLITPEEFQTQKKRVLDAL